LSRVRVSGCTPHLDTDRVAAHMAQFGRVVQSARGVDRSFGNVFDGVIHFTIQLHNDITLPHFIDIEDEGGHLAERLFVFSDQHRRRCFHCGHTGHVGQFCRAAIKASDASEALWSRMVLPAGAPAPPPVVFAVPTPPPPPAAVLPPLGAAAAPGRDASPPSVGAGSLPCVRRSRSGSMSSVASEAAGDFLSPASSLLGLGGEDPPLPCLLLSSLGQGQTPLLSLPLMGGPRWLGLVGPPATSRQRARQLRLMAASGQRLPCMRVLLKCAALSPLPLSIYRTPAPPRRLSISQNSALMESRSRDDGEAPGSLLTILSFNLHLMSDFAGLPHLLCEHRPHLAFVQEITPHTSIVEAAAAGGYSTFLSTSLSRPKRTIAVLSRVPVQVSSPSPGYSQLLSLGDLSFLHLYLPAGNGGNPGVHARAAFLRDIRPLLQRDVPPILSW
jgi:hypothetical protein